jgi:putative transposase
MFGFMERQKADHHITTMTRVLAVSTSGFYARRRRPKSLRAMEDEVLADMITTIHTASRATYGAPRIQAELRIAQGISCSRRRVARIMRQEGLRGVSRRAAHPITTVREGAATPARDLVQREFHATRPNLLWVADITYVPTLEGFLYLACVLDVCTRRCVGWAMRTTLHTEIVTAALEMAIERARPAAGLVHHSDHGSQYTSTVFGQRCRDAGIVPSMGTVGDCFDNAMAESFFATLECELIDRERFVTRDEARTKVFDYLETWYNPRRRHSALDYLSPVEYERRYDEKTITVRSV